ncbi:hypothetical protein GCM10022221_38200 [Actinocorallia aurea]
MSQLSEPVTVWTGPDGLPRRFVWRDRLFVVRRILEHWIVSRDWWREQHPESADPAERRFWRVEASPDRESGVYELRHTPETDEWTLSRVWR